MPYPSPATYPSELMLPGTRRSADPFTHKVALGGLVLNHVEDDGTTWTINPDGFEGWSGSPASTLALAARARGHGSTGSEAFLSNRSITISGIVKTSPERLSYMEDRLNAAVSLAPFLLAVADYARVRYAMVQRQDVVMFKMRRGDNSSADFSVQLVAKDPLKYGDLVVKSTLLPATRGGLVFPVTYPVTFTGSSDTGILRIDNPGNEQAPVWLRADGPIPAGGWAATHVGKQQTLAFASEMTLGAGEFVTVEMENREVLAQGQAQASRNGYVTSRGWFSLDPGPNEIAFTAQNYSPTAQLTVLTKPAWS